MFGIGGNLPAGGSPISLDALEQVSVSITPFDVRQSGFTGGAINAVTKSGTNDLKLSAYLYSKSDQLQGDKYDGGKLSLSEMRNNTLGFSVGAPIVRNKLFVFANFEREWNTTPGTSRLARTSDGQSFGGGSQYNRPTVEKLDEISNFLIDKYGYNPGPYQGYSVKTPGYKLMARVDWNINRNNSLNVRFSRTQNKYSSSPSSSISPLDSLIFALDRIGGAPELILEKLRKLSFGQEFSHIRAVCVNLMHHPDPQAEGELVRLLSEEGARGNAVRTLADALNSNRAERNDTSVRNSQLKELYLAKALTVCAPENPLGSGILKEYAESMQGYYVLFADGKLA